jgi:hypothetical protein
MKIKDALLIPLIVCGLTFLCGCEPVQRNNSTGNTSGSDTNSVDTNSPAGTNADGSLIPPPLPNTNAVTSDTVIAFDLRGMQRKLTTELSKNSKIVFLGRGLYFFATSEEESLDTIASYGREHTNLVAIAVFSAKENYDVTWYTGNGNIDLRNFPSSLNISNGMFAVFRDK